MTNDGLVTDRCPILNCDCCRSLLAHGETWYESHGYRLSSKAGRRLRLSVADAVHEYSKFPVSRLLKAVRKQVVALRITGVTWTHADPKMFSSSPDLSHATNTTRIRILHARNKLMSVLESAPHDAMLGQWLLALTCVQYSTFMRTMYGTRFGDVSTALAEVGGVRTPSFPLFIKANGLRRNSHKLAWIKDLSYMSMKNGTAPKTAHAPAMTVP